MAKRDRDTGIWKDKFYRSLPPLYKCFWDFVNDDCDNAGVWIVDFPGAKLNIGKKIDPEKALELFGDRVQIFDRGNKWHIKTFVSDKLGFAELNPAHKFQKSILDLLVKHKIDKIKGYPDTLQSVKEREGKDKDMGKDAFENKKEPEISNPDFKYELQEPQTESLNDVEVWTAQVLEGNDALFVSMVRNSGIELNGQLERLARDHLGLCARYKWHEKITTQQAFRLSLLGHATRELVKKDNNRTTQKKFTIDDLNS